MMLSPQAPPSVGSAPAQESARGSAPPLAADASIGLATLNARFVHLALSLRYLRNAAQAAGFSQVWLREFTIQMPAWKMAAELQALRPAVLGFSVYIWNREPTFALIELLKKQRPELVIVVGGPEVSFEPGPPAPAIDYVIGGEGERKWVELLGYLSRAERPPPEALARWRAYGTDLPELGELPYREEDLSGLEHRLAYLETSRGCPFHCSFCLSALDKQVRFFDDDAVKAQIETLIAHGARRIKFLDRTFNLRKSRVREFFRWLMDFEEVAFHFEVVGDLLDDTLVDLLDRAPPGRFQFEIGVQTTDEAVLGRIERRQRHERLFAMMHRLRQAGRVHLHADLVWGLPGETVAHIRRSFEATIAVRPHELQLGFLKFLPGAPIRQLIEEEGYVFQERPPYEVIRHRLLSAEELIDLKRFEEAFDAYYNSGRFAFTLEYLFDSLAPWDVFEKIAGYFRERGLLLVSHSLDNLYRHLLECFHGGPGDTELLDLLRLDYFYHHRANRVPDFLMDGELRTNGGPGRGSRRDGRTAAVPFRHRIELSGGRARLVPSGQPVWYGFSYPEAKRGYFFRPTLAEFTQPDGPPNR